MQSANLVPFAEISAIPAQRNEKCVARGLCAPTIDGGVYRGGIAHAGTAGYQLASLGYPAKECAAFPLFAGGNRQFALMGWEVTTNRNPLLVGIPQL